MRRIGFFMLVIGFFGCSAGGLRFTPAAESASQRMSQAKTRDEATQSKREFLIELIKAGNDPVTAQKTVAVMESYFAIFSETRVQRKLADAGAELYAGKITATAYAAKVLFETAVDPWYPLLGEESALLIVTLAEKVDRGEITLNQMSYELAKRDREITEARERKEREGALLQATQRAARPQIFFIDRGGSAAPGFTREQQMIQRCAGRAVDFVTGRCM